MKIFDRFTKTKQLSAASASSQSLDVTKFLNEIAESIRVEIDVYASLLPADDAKQLIRLIKLGQLHNSCEGLIRLLKNDSGKALYVISGLFLHRCYQKLIAYEVEHLFYVTGVRIGNLYTLDQICEFKVESASAVHASGDIRSTHITLINLENYGLQLHGLFHKHPGTGIGSTTPSSTDLHTQEAMERGGYPSIGAIFSEDGFIRFFSSDRDFDIKIYGEGVQHVTEKVFRIEKLRQIPDQRD